MFIHIEKAVKTITMMLRRYVKQQVVRIWDLFQSKISNISSTSYSFFTGWRANGTRKSNFWFAIPKRNPPAACWQPWADHLTQKHACRELFLPPVAQVYVWDIPFSRFCWGFFILILVTLFDFFETITKIIFFDLRTSRLVGINLGVDKLPYSVTLCNIML